jgi:hypothetical protein
MTTMARVLTFFPNFLLSCLTRLRPRRPWFDSWQFNTSPEARRKRGVSCIGTPQRQHSRAPKCRLASRRSSWWHTAGILTDFLRLSRRRGRNDRWERINPHGEIFERAPHGMPPRGLRLPRSDRRASTKLELATARGCRFSAAFLPAMRIQMMLPATFFAVSHRWKIKRQPCRRHYCRLTFSF